MPFKICAAWWNGHEFETVTKDAKNIDLAISLSNFLLKELRPKQIWIIDLDNKEPMPNNLYGVADRLNNDS